MEMATDMADPIPTDADIVQTPTPQEEAQPEHVKNLVHDIQKRIRSDRQYHEKAFDQMRRDMFVVKHGRVPEYPKEHYAANLAGRHVKQKTASLYAKNPKATARRRETLDFSVWDENPQSLMMAFQTVQMAQQMIDEAPPAVDPLTGEIVPDTPDIPPEVMAAFEEAQATIGDYQSGMQRRMAIQKIGRTLEILYAQALREQKPVDFKTGMKQLVRRACTTGVGYVELGFQREMGPRPTVTSQLADARDRLDHLERLMTEAREGEMEPDDAERAELEAAIAALQSEPEIVLREGLVVDFPQSTRVIPDQMCTSLVGFIGARHVTIEYLFTPEEVTEMFGVDLQKKYKGYTSNGKSTEADSDSFNVIRTDDDGELAEPIGPGKGLVCVWKHYDKPSGLVYYTADGYDQFLREPASPDVFVEDFWPVYALTFNAVENETELFPPSDVALMLDMQMEYNRSRQGMREHRRAARPRWGYRNGALDDKDIEALSTAEPFTATGVNIEPGTSVGDVLQPIPVPGVDPNLYETGQLFTDVQLVVGSSESQFGGLAKATATESAIAANSSASSDGSSIDDLDAFLTVVARASGQILMREMSPEKVAEVVGPGAVWPPMTLAEISSEIYLEVEAGSTGKPNQAVEIQNWKEMLPFLIQMPGIQPHWLAKETLRRLDDRMDLTEALSEGIPSIIMQNQMSQPGTGDPATEPTQQGGEGAGNAPAAPQGTGGSGPAFGSNQV